MEAPNEIDVPVWWSNGGGMSYRRDCLDADHPEQTYNYVSRTYGVDPREYGIPKPPPLDEDKAEALLRIRAEASGWPW